MPCQNVYAEERGNDAAASHCTALGVRNNIRKRSMETWGQYVMGTSVVRGTEFSDGCAGQLHVARSPSPQVS